MLVTVATFADAAEAHVVRGRLDAEGIPASVAFDGHVTLDWPMSQALGGVALQVPAAFAEAAAAIVSAYRAGEFAFARESAEAVHARRSVVRAAPDPSPACARCGRDEVRRRVPMRWKALAIAMTFIGGAVFPTRDEWSCRACGARWPAEV